MTGETITLGCRLNFAESEAMASAASIWGRLRKRNLKYVKASAVAVAA